MAANFRPPNGSERQIKPSFLPSPTPRRKAEAFPCCNPRRPRSDRRVQAGLDRRQCAAGNTRERLRRVVDAPRNPARTSRGLSSCRLPAGSPVTGSQRSGSLSLASFLAAPEDFKEHFPPLNRFLTGCKGTSMKENRENPGDLLQGTLDLLILKALARGAMHGYGVAEWIHQTSDDVLRVEEGARSIPRSIASSCAACSLLNGAFQTTIAAPSITPLTAAGRKQLAQETEFWQRMSGGSSANSANGVTLAGEDHVLAVDEQIMASVEVNLLASVAGSRSPRRSLLSSRHARTAEPSRRNRPRRSPLCGPSSIRQHD